MLTSDTLVPIVEIVRRPRVVGALADEGPRPSRRLATPVYEELVSDAPAWSRDVMHWMTIAEKRTAACFSADALEAPSAGALLSKLQLVRHNHPGSPPKTIKMDKLLQQSASPQSMQGGRAGSMPYAMLLSKVQAAPTKVLRATSLRRRLARVRGMCLKEYNPDGVLDAVGKGRGDGALHSGIKNRTVR